MTIGQPTAARTPASATALGSPRNRLAGDGRTRSPLVCRDLLHHLDFEITLSQDFLQPGVLLLQLLEPPNVVAIHLAEALAPLYKVFSLTPCALRPPLCCDQLAQHVDHLFFCKPALLHDFLLGGRPSSQVWLVRKPHGRSTALTEMGEAL
jgi:hypothetical protein